MIYQNTFVPNKNCKETFNEYLFHFDTLIKNQIKSKKYISLNHLYNFIQIKKKNTQKHDITMYILKHLQPTIKFYRTRK